MAEKNIKTFSVRIPVELWRLVKHLIADEKITSINAAVNEGLRLVVMNHSARK